MAILPFVQKQQIKDPSSSTIYGDLGALNRNVCVEIDQNLGEPALTQRPCLWHVLDATDGGFDKGRGAFSAPPGGGSVYVLGNDVYRSFTAGVGGGYTNQLTGALDAPAGLPAERFPVQFDSLGSQTIICDSVSTGIPLYYTDSGPTYTSITGVTDADFPADIHPGVVVLGGYVFVYDSITGKIRNSALGDVTSWAALDAIEANRTNPKSAQYLGRHNDNLVAFKEDSIEYFYLAVDSRSSGTPLNRRNDVFHSVGLPGPNDGWGWAVVNVGKDIYFPGKDKNSVLGLYQMRDFQLTKVSDHYLDAALRRWRDKASNLVAGAIPGHGRTFLAFTTLNFSTGAPEETLIFDTEFGYTAKWDTAATGFSEGVLPAMQGALLTSWPNSFMAMNGDLIQARPEYSEIDRSTANVRIDIPIEVRTENHGFGVTGRKFCNSLGIIGYDDEQTTQQSLSVQHSDDNMNSYSTARPIAMDPKAEQRIYACGSFYRRSWKITGTMTDRFWLYALDVDVEAQ